jgi:mxaA protein
MISFEQQGWEDYMGSKQSFLALAHSVLPATLLLLFSPFASAVPPPRVELSAPRDYGYVMGDLIEHTLTATVPESYTLETGFLPKPGALDEWLEVRSVNWDENRANGETRYRIRVIYQLFKGVRSPEKAVVPALPLRFAGAEPLEAKAPAWEFTVTPLIPPQLADENVAIRGSLPPAPVAAAPHRHRLLAYLAGALSLCGGLAWQKWGRTHRARPFARARRELKKLLRSPASPERFRAAVKLLHRALDETAGGTLFAGQVDRFCASRPAFAEIREELAGFFALSRRLFFTAPEVAVPSDYPAERLENLCRRCAAAERRTP